MRAGFGTSLAVLFVMPSQRQEDIFGLVTACDWDEYGNPLKIRVCAEGEVDYEVMDNDMGKKLKSYIREWVQIRGEVLEFDSLRVIDVQEICKKQ